MYGEKAIWSSCAPRPARYALHFPRAWWLCDLRAFLVLRDPVSGSTALVDACLLTCRRFAQMTNDDYCTPVARAPLAVVPDT